MPRENPFPGMNPWLEAHWGDVHTSLTTYARDLLQTQLPLGLRARVEEYVGVECEDHAVDPSRFVPDVRVIEQPPLGGNGGVATAVEVEVAVPAIVPRLPEPQTLHVLHIVDSAAGNRIVTSIEFLSLANKSSEAGREQYKSKQQKMLDGGVNLVEVDLLRGGRWVIAAPMISVPTTHRAPYRVCVVRATRQDVAEVYRASVDEPLPTIAIPLRPDDKDVHLQLQKLLNLAYTNGAYGEDIDYRNEPDPPLAGALADQIDQWLRKQGLRPGS